MSFEVERKKLFDEVWKEPMTTVAKRYELSDNGLRKRCIKLEIPLPPAGYWAKMQAGKPVPAKPELFPYKAIAYLKETAKIDKKSNIGLELIDISSKSSEELEELDGLDLLTSESKEKFLGWCKKAKVPKRIAQYDPLITDYQAEMEYRKSRDEQHRFRDIFRYSMSHMADNSKIKYRENKAVLPISVSTKQSKRAFGFVETLIKLVGDLNGTVCVSSGEKDNANITLFRHSFSFHLAEIMVKRRSLLSGQSHENVSTDLRPLYEKVYSGRFRIEFTEILAGWYQDKTLEVFEFEDSVDNPIENQMGDIFITLCKAANEAMITDIVAKRERGLVETELQRAREIDQEKQRSLQQIEEQNRRKKKLVENIKQQHMEDWFISQKLLKYAEELEVYASGRDDENRKLLSAYIELVRQQAEERDPVAGIIDEMKGILFKGKQTNT